MILAVLAVSWFTVVLGLMIGNNSVLFPYLIVDPALAFTPRLLLAALPVTKTGLKPSWLNPVELFIFFIILANAPGSLYLHSLPIQYDRFLHYFVGFILMFMTIPILGPIFKRLFKGQQKYRFLIWSALLLFIGLFAWEFYQWAMDQLFGTHLFGDIAQPIQVDVAEDIAFGTIGLLSALPLMFVPRVWSWLTQGQLTKPSAATRVVPATA